MNREFLNYNTMAIPLPKIDKNIEGTFSLRSLNDSFCISKKNKNYDPNIEHILELDIKSILILRKEYFLGRGSYGSVFLINDITEQIRFENKNVKYVIKISRSRSSINEYQNEAYFYEMCKEKNKKEGFLPKFIRIGKSIDVNLNKNIKYDYMILEYVGKNNLEKVFSRLSIINKGKISKFINILYICLFSQLSSIHEAYFYEMCKEKNKKEGFLPKFIRIGKSIDVNLNKNIKYDYMILEYVGKNNLEKVFSRLSIINKGKISKFINILYICLFSQLSSIHETDLTIRDISFANVVVRDDIIFMERNGNYTFILKDMIENFEINNYGEIVKFIDLGLAGNMKYLIETKQYDPENLMFTGDFYQEKNDFDGLFVGRADNISPFAIFNLSSLISDNNPENNGNDINQLLLKVIIDNCMVMADFWCLCIIFAIKIYDMIFRSDYHSSICKNMTPFIIKDNKFYFKKEIGLLFNIDLNIENSNFEGIRTNLLFMLNYILEYSNELLKYSIKKDKRYHLQMTNDTMMNLYKESKNTINNLYQLIDSYKAEFTNLFIKNKYRE